METVVRARQQLYQYTPTPTEDALLTSIAQTQLPCRGYARGLLYLLKGERFPLDEYPSTPQNAALRQAPPTQAPANDFVRLYPNPTSEQLVLRLRPEELEQGGSYRILDATGQERMSLTIVTEQRALLDLSDLPSGLYFLELRIEGKHQRTYPIVRL